MAANARCFSSLRSILLNKASCLQTQQTRLYAAKRKRFNPYTTIYSASINRRLEKGQAGNKTRYGPLTDLPDFTYLDGRPTPLTSGQKERKEGRIQTAKRIMELVGEMETAQLMYDNRVQEKENELKQRQKLALRAKVQ